MSCHVIYHVILCYITHVTIHITHVKIHRVMLYNMCHVMFCYIPYVMSCYIRYVIEYMSCCGI